MDQAAGQVQPMTEDITRDVIRPGGEKISKNAVPVTKHIAEQQIQPAVDQVGTISLQLLAVFICVQPYVPSHEAPLGYMEQASRREEPEQALPGTKVVALQAKQGSGSEPCLHHSL